VGRSPRCRPRWIGLGSRRAKGGHEPRPRRIERDHRIQFGRTVGTDVLCWRVIETETMSPQHQITACDGVEETPKASECWKGCGRRRLICLVFRPVPNKRPKTATSHLSFCEYPPYPAESRTLHQQVGEGYSRRVERGYSLHSPYYETHSKSVISATREPLDVPARCL
jgi:hypothetical protein